ncbi:MAG: siroheme synthase [Alphaproteobacteria bacterium]|nr:siroheme synthase [Alphaproteobacteria bacterium]
MLPLILDLKGRRIVVAGRGHAALQRYEFVRDAGAETISLYIIDQDGWACHAEAALFERLPVKADLEGAAVVFVAGLGEEDTSRIVHSARAAGALVNAEDVPEHCDFHVPSVVRRGDLLLTISTGGKAPGFSRRIRAQLQEQFGPEWIQYAKQMIEARGAWRAAGRTKAEIIKLTDALIEREGWLKTKERV